VEKTPRQVDRYQAALDYLLGRVNYEKSGHRPYSANHYKLNRMRALLGYLGNPQDRLPTIHIAGTKGKGSTATFLSAIARAAGYKTGLYTSPHFLKIEERFTVDGKQCEPDQLIELVEQLEKAEEKLVSDCGEQATFFELSTALAWLYFEAEKVDLAVIEVGLGGRLDSTNVCSPILTIITSISFDHQAQLGNSIAEIAGEKAGIIKRKIPLVCGARHPEAREVIQRVAVENQSPFLQLGEHFEAIWKSCVMNQDAGERDTTSKNTESKDTASKNTASKDTAKLPTTAVAPISMPTSADLPSADRLLPEARRPVLTSLVDYETQAGELFQILRDVIVGMPGRHQKDNAALAITAAQWLKQLGWSIDPSQIREGLQNAIARGRFEVVGTTPIRIIDTAHNEASIRSLIEAMKDYFPKTRKIVLFAASRDKDIRAMLLELIPAIDLLVITQYRESPRAISIEQLQEIIAEVSSDLALKNPKKISFQPLIAKDPAEAWEMGLQLSGPDDLLCATGSFFFAAELFPVIGLRRFTKLTENNRIADGDN
jgi:dihydrofolate synthase/folylpolyglutamate synthase